VESRFFIFEVMSMDSTNTNRFGKVIAARAADMVQEQQLDEIERAIRNAKRTAWDKWFRRQFYRAAAQRERRYRRMAASRAPQRSERCPWARRWMK